MQVLQTLNGLLEHIKSVEAEVVGLTKEGHLQFMKFIEKNSLHLDDEILEVMQYQDIIAQQLGATMEAIEAMQGHLNDKEVRLDEMDDNVTSILERAREKHSAFGGKTHHQNDDGVEFF